MSYLIVYFLIAAVIGVADILPLIYRHSPWRYVGIVLTENILIGLVVFYARVDGLAWWLQGVAIGLLLTLPTLMRPAPRGAYRWYTALGNGMLVGLVAATVEAKLPGLAAWLT